jgi:type II secretory pathway component PulF
MPEFAYRALDIEGRLVEGRVEGADLQSVTRRLVEEGYSIQNIGVATPRIERPAQSEPGPSQYSPLTSNIFGRVELPDLSFFFRQLATMSEAGINPAQALQTLSAQSRSPKLAAIIMEARAGVEGGKPLSVSFEQHPEVFTPLMLSLLRAGEQGGFVDSALKQIADYIDQEIKLRQLLRRVTLYPKLVIAASILIFLAGNAIIAAVAPNSPIRLTSILTTPSTWLCLGPLIAGLWIFVRYGLKQAAVKQSWDQLILNLPGLGTTSRQYAMAKFGRAFGALYKGGVPLQNAFKLAADACGNEALRAAMQPAVRELETGAGVADTFRATGAFNPIVLDMVATGEQTGNLDLMLNKMSEFYEGEAETRSHQAAMITGVVMLLLVAAYVGYTYITNLGAIGSMQTDVLKDE